MSRRRDGDSSYCFLCLYLSLSYEEMGRRDKGADKAFFREDALLAKKVYVHYISHEMRTPLNVMQLGLKVLEKDLVKSRPRDKKR